MTTLLYLLAIVIVYVLLTERMERAVQSTFRSRTSAPPVMLVEDFNPRPRHGRGPRRRGGGIGPRTTLSYASARGPTTP